MRTDIDVTLQATGVIIHETSWSGDVEVREEVSDMGEDTVADLEQNGISTKLQEKAK